MNNRLVNAIHNTNQSNRKKVLTVCSAGLLRSPTAARVLAEKYDYNTRACGVVDDYALIVLDAVLISWADEIVFMDKGHYNMSIVYFEDYKDTIDKKATILSIPDVYEYMEPELVSAIERQYEESNNS